MSKRLTSTDKVELVETHNLALALKRIETVCQNSTAWKRALYHAISMSGISSYEELAKIRNAIGLP